MMEIIAEIIVSVFLIFGGVFGLIGSLGLVKLRDCMQRMHAPTKSATLGVGAVLVASMLYFLLLKGKLSFHEILIILFLLVTAPISANFIAKVYIQAHKRREDLPETRTKHGWAVYDEPPMQ